MMTERILLLILLLTFLYVAPGFSQTEKNDLTVKFIRFNKIQLPKDKCRGDFCEFDERTKEFLVLLLPLLSKNGSLEIDSRGNALIITDKFNRVEIIEKFVKILDKSSLDFNDLISRKSNEPTNYRLKIQLQNLTLSTNCGTGQQQTNWQEKQSEILLSIIRNFLSANATIEIDVKEKTLTITDNQNRTILIKEIAELFDKPFLEETN